MIDKVLLDRLRVAFGSASPSEEPPALLALRRELRTVAERYARSRALHRAVRMRAA